MKVEAGKLQRPSAENEKTLLDAVLLKEKSRPVETGILYHSPVKVFG